MKRINSNNYQKTRTMKKYIFPALVVIAIFASFFVSCEKDDITGRHQYTEEELAEIRRQDSLRQIIPADYVFTQDVILPYSDNWEGVTVKLVQGKDTAKLLELFEYNTTAELVAALGTLEGSAPDLVQTGNDITFYAYNWSTKYEVNDPSSTNSFGHWFDANGDATTWGNGQILFCEKTEGATLEFLIGHLPGGPAVGDKFHIVEAMKYDTTSVAFVFNITIADKAPLIYPNTTIAGTSTYSIEADMDNNYTATPVNIDAAAISAAIGIAPGDAEIYGISETSDSLYILGSTAEAPGYWFNSLGDVSHWGDTLCAIYANYIIADELINVGQFPGGVTSGETYTVKLAFVNLDNLKQYTVVVNVKITGSIYPETTLEQTINLGQSVAFADSNVWTDNLLPLDSAAIQAAIGCGPSAAQLFGVNASNDSLSMNGFTANNGCWFNADGDVCSWGAEGISMYVEYRPATHEIGFGQMPAACVPGTTYYGRLAFVNGTKRVEVEVAMTINQ
jgi:hypothetical protein